MKEILDYSVATQFLIGTILDSPVHVVGNDYDRVHNRVMSWKIYWKHYVMVNNNGVYNFELKIDKPTPEKFVLISEAMEALRQFDEQTIME
jgi:hypothetical protein